MLFYRFIKLKASEFHVQWSTVVNKTFGMKIADNIKNKKNKVQKA